MILEQKIDKLIENLILLTGKVEQRAKMSEQTTIQASQSLVQAAQSVSGTTQDIQRVTSKIIGVAIQKPVDDLEHSLQIIRNELIHSSNNVEKRLNEASQKLKLMIWFAMSAFVLAGLVCIGVTLYALTQVNKEIKQAEFISSINTAIDNGKLIACPDGGVCANVDKKTIRLDR